MSHLDDNRIAELLDGEVPSQEFAAIHAHLSECAACRARLAEAQAMAAEADRLLVALDDEIAGAAATVAPTRAATRPSAWVRRLAWAASLALAAGAGWMSRSPQYVTTRVVDTVAIAAVVDSDPVPTAAPAAAPVRPTSPPASTEQLAERAANLAQERAREPDPATHQDAAAPIAPAPEAERTLARDAAVAKATADALSGAAAGRTDLGARGQPAPVALAPTEQSRLVPRRQALEFAAPGGAVPLELPEAIRRLGGSIRLVDGLVPDRLEAVGDAVHVVYPVAGGELRLVQRRTATGITWRLEPPAGLAPDSVAALRARVRE